MVANVLFVIIPGQRELVHAKQQGREPDAAPGLRGQAAFRAQHVFHAAGLFVMISNHYAMTYGARHNWLVLIAVSFAGACIRAWFVARHKPQERSGYARAMPAVLGVLTLAGVVLALAPSLNVKPASARVAGPGGGWGAGATDRRAALRALPCGEPDRARLQCAAQRYRPREHRASTGASAAGAATARHADDAAWQSHGHDRR
jgi:hypothetical protein